jgi:hypothetical protein
LKNTSPVLWLLQTVLNNPHIPIPAKNRKKEGCTTLERKRNTRSVKNLYTANQKGLIIYKTKRRQRGRRHDYKVYKKNHPKLPKDVLSMLDLGFFGGGRERLSRTTVILTNQKGERS